MAVKFTKGQICDGTISKNIAMSQGVQFTWKISYLFHKVHNFRTMSLY